MNYIKEDNKMLEWKDTTSYNRNDIERKPRYLEAKAGLVDLCIHKYVGCGEQWFLSSKELNIDRYELKTLNIEKAKEEALNKARHFTDLRWQAYKEALDILWN
jgi:hypothetical protein